MPFIDHFSVGVADLVRSGSFYDALLATIGAARRLEKPDFICYGTSSGEFFVVNVPDDKTKPIAPSNGFHVCFAAPDPEAVRRFHAIGLIHGGSDNGAPGYRRQYAPDYYGAFLIDPDGHHVGAVCRTRVIGRDEVTVLGKPGRR
jgi:catechol 2,3-dioxygenase-like lactoylglutathione lyase family enzyme